MARLPGACVPVSQTHRASKYENHQWDGILSLSVQDGYEVDFPENGRGRGRAGPQPWGITNSSRRIGQSMV